MLAFIPNLNIEKTLLQANTNKLISCKIDQSKNILIFSQKGPNDFLDASTQIISLAQNSKILAHKIVKEQEELALSQQQQKDSA